MNKNLVAKASISMASPTEKVWDAFVNPDIIKEYMFGTQVVSDWTKGSSIVWKGEWKGTHYEDKGEILEIIPEKKLQYSHFSPLSGKEDVPENYHTVTVEIVKKGTVTEVYLYQDHCADEKEQAHSEQNWNAMLEKVKKTLEK